MTLMAVIDIEERTVILFDRRYTCCKLGIELTATGMALNKLLEILRDWRDDNGLNADDGNTVRRLEPKLLKKKEKFQKKMRIIAKRGF